MPSPRTALLVAPSADALASDVSQARSDLAVTAAGSDTAARAYLAATTFDVIIVAASMPAGTGESLDALAASLGHPARVLAGAPPTELAAWLADRLPDTMEPATPAPASGGTKASTEQVEAMQWVSEELARLAHALNNPLAVIDGNAQLALEMSRALSVDTSVVSAIEDIQGGSRQLAALLSEIAALRTRIDATIG